jgi:predicted O-methyltransferase YrrM
MNENYPNPEELRKYLDRRFGQEDAVLHQIRQTSTSKDLPPIQIPIYLGKLLNFLAKTQQAKYILEIGTLGGYSTVWLARALPLSGHLISIEMNPLHCQIAKEHVNLAGLTHLVEIRQGYAVDLLSKMATEQLPSFDFVFIDADKENNVLYLDWAIHLSRPGSLILIDNLIPKGKNVGYASHKEATEIYAFNDYLAMHPKLETVLIPTLVRDGRLDGLALTRIKDR